MFIKCLNLFPSCPNAAKRWIKKCVCARARNCIWPKRMTTIEIEPGREQERSASCSDLEWRKSIVCKIVESSLRFGFGLDCCYFCCLSDWLSLVRGRVQPFYMHSLKWPMQNWSLANDVTSVEIHCKYHVIVVIVSFGLQCRNEED